eukprot:ANDGO_06018.mRNA.1 T-cell immunomodulatory protein homolog
MRRSAVADCAGFFLFLLLVVGGVGVVRSSFWNPWKGNAPEFASEGLYPVSVASSAQGLVLSSFGDVNSDKYTDAFWINPERSLVQIAKWDHDSFGFSLSENLDLDFSGEPGAVHSTYPSDFNGDGRMDLLVVRRLENSTLTATTYLLDFFFQDADLKRWQYSARSAARSCMLPMVFDATGDLVPDVLIQDCDSKQLVVLVNDARGPVHPRFRTAVFSQFCPDCFPESILSPSFRLALQESNAVLDLDGDCAADIVLFYVTGDPSSTGQAVMMLVARHSGNSKFSPVMRMQVPLNAYSVSFADIDADGNVDIMVPTCESVDATSPTEGVVHLHQLINLQKGVCTSETDSNCRSEKAMCSAASFTFTEKPKDYGHRVFSLGTTCLLPTSKSDLDKSSPGGFFTPKLRFGDLDLDGFPDSVFVHQGGVLLLRNDRGDSWSSGSTFGGRVSHSIFAPITNAISAAFLDLDENGILDLAVISWNSEKKAFETTFLYTNFYLDAFFLKVLGLNGVCASWCSEGSRFPNPKPFGVNMPGVSSKFVVTQLDGSKVPASGFQLAQLGSQNLEMPYAVYGLGRTNNYIEYFYMGFPNGVHRDWNALIPNAQVIAINYPPSSPDEWQLEMFISPAAIILWMIFTLGLIFLALGIPIAVYKWRELKEDKEEKQRTAHLFSFDAL